LVKKGATLFKFDLSLIFEESCKHFTSKYDPKDCQTVHEINVCCIGLVGDTSSIPFMNNVFNNTYELLEVFADKNFQQSVQNLNKTLGVQLDIQPWLQTLETNASGIFMEFLGRLNKILMASALDIEFYFGSCPVFDWRELCKINDPMCGEDMKAILANTKNFQCTAGVEGDPNNEI
jgi:hypothetical protein